MSSTCDRISRRNLLQAGALAAAAAISRRAWAGGPANGKPVGRKGPLADLPSRPGAHIEKIKSLGDNEWLNLGSPAPDPKWGKGRGRSWSCHMAYAPDLQGAFLVGQGVHGYIKPDGRYDDIFFYDLNAHRWICIYPGFQTKTILADIKNGVYQVNDAGQLVNREGEPVLLGYGGHSYHTHEYDPDQKKYIMTFSRNGIGLCQHMPIFGKEWYPELKKLLEEQKKAVKDRVASTPLFYDTMSGKFERFPADGPRPPQGSQGAGTAFYLPSKKLLWQHGGVAFVPPGGVTGTNETIFYNTATRTWSNARPTGTPPTGIDHGACYDSKRDRIYLWGGGHGVYRAPRKPGEGMLYVYDVKSNNWSNVPDKGVLPKSFGTNNACVHYDSANDKVILANHWENSHGVFIFDPESASWGDKPLPLGKGVPHTSPAWHGFYCPELNAHFIYSAPDSGEGEMWVYRHKSGARGK
jgi:hypothetical protein